MPRSTVGDILRVMNEIGKLDKKGKLAILNDLLKQDLEPKFHYSPPSQPSAIKPVTYQEGEK